MSLRRHQWGTDVGPAAGRVTGGDSGPIPARSGGEALRDLARPNGLRIVGHPPFEAPYRKPFLLSLFQEPEYGIVLSRCQQKLNPNVSPPDCTGFVGFNWDARTSTAVIDNIPGLDVGTVYKYWFLLVG